jgi:hypothetical protein
MIAIRAEPRTEAAGYWDGTPEGAVPTVRQATEQAEFTYMCDCMKSTFLLKC